MSFRVFDQLRAKNLNLRALVTLIVAAPVMLAVAMATWIFLFFSQIDYQLKTTASIVDLGIVLVHLVHEQQKERGATVVFVKSDGLSLAEKLAEQR